MGEFASLSITLISYGTGYTVELSPKVFSICSTMLMAYKLLGSAHKIYANYEKLRASSSAGRGSLEKLVLMPAANCFCNGFIALERPRD